MLIDQQTMNQEEDEDAFLYGDTSQPTAPRPSGSAAPVDQEMEPASEEGEVDDEDDDEESDSVLTIPYLSNSQDIEFVIETEPGKRAAPPPYAFYLLYVDDRSAQPFALRLTSQSRPAATPEKSTSTANQIKAGTYRQSNV